MVLFPLKSDPARLFVAISIPEDVKSILSDVQNQYRSLTDQFSFTHPENLHLTLVFLGSTPVSHLDRLQETIRTVVAQHQSFILSILDHGAFPRFEKARVLFQNATADGPMLHALQHELATRLELEFAYALDDRDFHPHITLGRIKKKYRGTNITDWKVEDPPSVAFDVDEITLLESHFHKGKLTYLPVTRFPLG